MGPYQVPLLWVRVGLGVMAMKESSAFPKTPALLEPDCLVSYPGHLLGESYPSVEIQFVYSTATVDWA